MNYQYLKWDSDFFNYRVVRIDYDESILSSSHDIIEGLKKDKIKLAYIAVNNIEKQNETYRTIVHDFISNKLGGIFVDEKITLNKIVHKNNDNSFTNHISEYLGPSDKKNIYELALISGEYSRYRIDNKFCNDEFKRLYYAWVDNAINNVNSEKVFVFREEEIIHGFITLKLHQLQCIIGLLAVDPEHQGKSIGSTMISYAEKYCLENGCSELRVVTQKANMKALKFYQKHGFLTNNIKLIYHLWID
jgi:dTDP-4-amino-4,6-dideoxy-D-galactose acyltransferase